MKPKKKIDCPYCKRAKAALAEIGIPITALELDLREDGREIQAALLAKTGQRTVPSVWLAGKHIGGSDDTIKAVSDGTFSSLQTDQAIEFALEHGVKKSCAEDGLPCLCTPSPVVA